MRNVFIASALPLPLTLGLRELFEASSLPVFRPLRNVRVGLSWSRGGKTPTLNFSGVCPDGTTRRRDLALVPFPPDDTTAPADVAAQLAAQLAEPLAQFVFGDTSAPNGWLAGLKTLLLPAMVATLAAADLDAAGR